MISIFDATNDAIKCHPFALNMRPVQSPEWPVLMNPIKELEKALNYERTKVLYHSFFGGGARSWPQLQVYKLLASVIARF